MDESMTIPTTVVRRKRSPYSIYASFTGKKFQVILFVLTVSCLISGLLIASQLKNIELATHALNSFYNEFKMVTIIYFITGIVAFTWFLLDVFVCSPKIKKRRNLKRSQRIKNSTKSEPAQDGTTTNRLRISEIPTWKGKLDFFYDEMSIDREDSTGAACCMSLREYDIMRGRFHPTDRSSSGGGGV